MGLKFEKLEVWRIALECIDKVYALLEKYPKAEEYILKQQGKRSITSVALNIAEGSCKHTQKDFAHFANTAIGSLVETIANLKIGLQREYILLLDYKAVEPLLDKLYFKLLSLEKYLRS
jgi:four helix bundle protein